MCCERATRAVALRFDVSESWVRRIKQERRDQGKTAPKTAPKTTRSRRLFFRVRRSALQARLRAFLISM